MSDATGVLARARAEPIPMDTLRQVLARTHPDASIVEVRPLPGGLGSVMDLVVLAGSATDAVLRRLLPEWGDDAASLRREALTHRLLRKHGLPVPAVRWTDDVGRAFGRPALLMDFAPGHPICVDLRDDDAIDRLASAAVALHGVTAERAGHLDRLVDAADYLDRYGPRPPVSEVVDAAALASSLDHLPALAADESCVVHGDLHGGNVLWDNQDVTAMLDWTGAAVGARWWDVGYLWLDSSLMYGAEVGDQIVAAYLDAGGHPIDDDEWWYWRGVALARALPSPRMWLPGYVGTGVIHLTADLLDERFATMVANHLEETP